MNLALRTLVGLGTAFGVGVAGVPDAMPYRWRRIVDRENVSALALPTKGVQALVATGGEGDILRDSSRRGRIPMERVTGVAVGDYAPDSLVAVGESTSGGNLRFSIDGGDSWRPCPNPPSFKDGQIVVSSDGKIWVWSGADGARRTNDFGFTWIACDGLSEHAHIVADRTSSRRFYALDGGRLFISDDGGGNFEERPFELPGGLASDDEVKSIVPTPGRVGDLWLLTHRVLYRSAPGKPFLRVPGVTDPVALGTGLASRETAAPGPLRTMLYLAGTVEGRTGLFRSDDEGLHWTLLAGAPPNSSISSLSGDPRRAGRVFVTLSSGGLLAGELRR